MANAAGFSQTECEIAMLVFHEIVRVLAIMLVIIPIGGRSELKMPKNERLFECFNSDEKTVRLLVETSKPVAVGLAPGVSVVKFEGVKGAKRLYIVVVPKE